MAVNRFVDRQTVSAAEAYLAHIADAGSASHPHLCALVEGAGAHSARDIADAVHLLCSVHGRHPELVEMALSLAPSGPAHRWLQGAADGFERERLYLVRLTAAVGPLPSTPGAAQTEAALAAQRNALEILGRSERSGCALGAAIALVTDWSPIRRLLDRAAARAGTQAPLPTLPDEAAIAEVIGQVCDSPTSERALAFGGEQLLLQHRALLDLLQARAAARGDW
jgi:hypothetical protein